MPIIGGRQIGVRGLGFQGAGKPSVPTSVSATDVGTARAFNNGAATVTWSAPSSNGAPISSYTVLSSPGGYTATTSSTSVQVTGLQSSTSYTFTVTATNAVGTSDASAASAAMTATTVPQAPTIGTPTCATGQSYTGSANISVAFTAGATGGKAISSFTATSSSSATGSGASSPITVSQTVGSSYTYTVTATNANGTSTASGTSASVLAASVPQAPTIGTATRTGNTTVSQAYTANATGGSAITSVTATSSPSISLSTSGTSSPVTITGTFVQGTGYTFTLTQSNAYGTSSASASSNSVTPYPTPVLSAWTADTNIPAGDTRIIVAVGGLMTNPNAPQFWAGSGYDNNGNPSLVGYNFTTSWSSANLPNGSFGLGAGRISGTSAAGPRGEVGSQFFIYNGSSWSTGANSYPISSTPWIGTAAMSGGIRYAAGQNEQRSWSQTDANSTFTAQTSYPFNTQLSAVDNGTFNGNMYTFNQTAGPTTMYYATSLSSGWTAGAAQPATSGNIPQSTTDNNNIIVSWKNVNAMYAFNKSNNTFTSIGTPPTTGFYAQTYSKDGLIRSVQKTVALSTGTHHYASYA